MQLNHVHWLAFGVGLAVGYFLMPAIISWLSSLFNR